MFSPLRINTQYTCSFATQQEHNAPNPITRAQPRESNQSSLDYCKFSQRFGNTESFWSSCGCMCHMLITRPECSSKRNNLVHRREIARRRGWIPEKHTYTYPVYGLSRYSYELYCFLVLQGRIPLRGFRGRRWVCSGASIWSGKSDETETLITRGTESKTFWSSAGKTVGKARTTNENLLNPATVCKTLQQIMPHSVHRKRYRWFRNLL